MVIYQLLPRLWGNMTDNPLPGASLEENGSGKFSCVDAETLNYLKGLGVTHVWYAGVLRHAGCYEGGYAPEDIQWIKGRAGSPYAVCDYYDVNPYLADNPSDRMEEFKELIVRTHEKGMKVLMDFIPNHVARNYGKFSNRTYDLGKEDDPSIHWSPSNDFFYYPHESLRLPNTGEYKEEPAKASGNCFSSTPCLTDWYDTVKLNYCPFHTPTWDKMLDIILYWAALGVDGFRCDMVELVPIEFLTWLIKEAKSRKKGLIFIAEIYNRQNYSRYVREACFDFLYDKSGIYDALWNIVRAEITGKEKDNEQWQGARTLTWNWQYLGDLQPHMLNFLENHDEPRFASDFFGADAGNSYAALYAGLLFSTCPFMLYFGQEIGERGMDIEGFSGLDGRTSIFDWWSVASLRRLWRHIHGDTDALNEKERETLTRYSAALQLAGRKVVCEGKNFDLCYCNLTSKGFDPRWHFVFLRHIEGESLLVACNFSSSVSQMEISVPEEAFNYLEMSQNEICNADTPIKITIQPMDGVILRVD